MKRFHLTQAILAAHAHGRVIALAPDAVGAVVSLASTPPLPTLGTVPVVTVLGPIAQRAQDDLCGYVDGYDAIAGRLVTALRAPEARAVVLRVDSPGGDVAGLEEAITRVNAVRAETGKQILAFADEQIASAAYWLASGVANGGLFLPQSGTMGAIGTMVLHLDESRALDAGGIKVTIVRDPPGKAAGHPFERLGDIARGQIEALVRETSTRFVDAVATARRLTAERVRGLNGAVLLGAAAVQAGLADGIDTLEGVLARAATAPRVAVTTPARATAPAAPFAPARAAAASLAPSPVTAVTAEDRIAARSTGVSLESVAKFKADQAAARAAEESLTPAERRVCASLQMSAATFLKQKRRNAAESL
jgi:ClpP class serine protease